MLQFIPTYHPINLLSNYYSSLNIPISILDLDNYFQPGNSRPSTNASQPTPPFLTLIVCETSLLLLSLLLVVALKPLSLHSIKAAVILKLSLLFLKLSSIMCFPGSLLLKCLLCRSVYPTCDCSNKSSSHNLLPLPPTFITPSSILPRLKT